MSKLLRSAESFANKRNDFGFEYLSFETRAVSAGGGFAGATGGNELAMVVLGGVCSVKSSAGEWGPIGGRKNVFDGKPWTLYLPVGTEFEVKAEIETLDSFSGHADHDELIEWFGKVTGPKKKVFLVHGEPERSGILQTALQMKHPESNFTVAAFKQTVEL